jgi:predicted Rossmann fold nucleotide-binding protein DprA/Smf involved in DNA uptake
MTADCANNRESFENYYDRIEVCEAAASAHFKSAIQVRNRAMVDRSNLVICCIERKAGGAYQTIRYAEKQGKHIVNVADDGCGDGSLLYP